MFASSRMLYSIGTLLCLAALMAGCAGQVPASPEPEQAERQTKPAVPTAQPTSAEFTSPLPQEQSPLPTPTDEAETETGGQMTEPVEIVLPGKSLPPGQDPGTIPLTGEVSQDLLGAVFDDLLERLEVSRDAITVEQAGAVVWRDGSLGCPQPGMMYTQAEVDGYWVVLMADDKELDYRAAQSGFFVLCERSPSLPSAPPGEVVHPTPEQ